MNREVRPRIAVHLTVVPDSVTLLALGLMVVLAACLKHGQQLVELVRETNSRAKIICMSGGIAQRIAANTEFLQKPFLAKALCACVDKLLHQS